MSNEKLEEVEVKCIEALGVYTMDKLIEVVAKHGINKEALRKMNETQLRKLAKTLGIDVQAFMPRKTVRVETGKNGARYVVTGGFQVPKYENGKIVPGKLTLARNLYLRAEAIDQVIADLIEAKGLLK